MNYAQLLAVVLTFVSVGAFAESEAPFVAGDAPEYRPSMYGESDMQDKLDAVTDAELETTDYIVFGAVGRMSSNSRASKAPKQLAQAPAQ